MGMMETSYTVRFVTPAFLGDADQRGRWRTPPFKALMRQWWRVAAAKECDYKWEQLRKREGELFGHAWLEKWAMRSQVRVLLNNWKNGCMNNWPKSAKVKHPEVNFSVDANLYLGYGPLIYDKAIKGTMLKNKAPCIGVNETATLNLQYPQEQAETFRKTIDLMQLFATIGARSRNGWGSFVLEDNQIKSPYEMLSSPAYADCLRNFGACLSLDWPHAIGMDRAGPLVWRSDPFGSWQEAQQRLASIKIALRTNCSISKNTDAKNPILDERHFLAYPVTNHGVKGWCDEKNGKPILDKRGKLKQTERLASQIRFKVLQDHERKYRGVIYHMPCGLPKVLTDLLKSKEDKDFVKERQLGVWQKVHRVLDSYEGKGLTRVKGGV